MNRRNGMLLWMAVTFFLWGCALHRPTDTADQIVKADSTAIDHPATPETPPIVPANPRLIEAELRFTISDIQLYSGQALRRHNQLRGVPPAAPPQLYIWMPAIIRRPNQIVLDLGIEGPLPTDIFYEEENGNQIYFWDLSSLIAKQKEIVLKRKVKVQASELFTLLDTTQYPAYDFSDRTYQFYTKEEPNIEITPEIRELALKLAGKEPNPYKKARILFDWVRSNLRYRSPSGSRGSAAALRTRKGDSAQFSFLFIAMCRAVGIPARFVTGFMVKTSDQLSRHSWAEFYLPGHGWVPADPIMGENRFGYLSNRGFVAAVGQNIPLKHAPFWATYDNSEVQENRTPIMQMATVVYTGLRARFSTEIKLLQFSESNAVLLSNKDNPQ